MPSKTQETVVNNPYFSDPSKDYVFKSNIKVFERSFGGILIIKKLGQAQHRIAFTTEMGNTLFDFSLEKDHLTVNRIIKDLDRNILINVLKKDFLALVTERITSIEKFQKGAKVLQMGFLLGKKHYYWFENGELRKIIRTGNGKEKVVFRFSGISDNIAQQIEIEHKNIQLRISLKSI